MGCEVNYYNFHIGDYIKQTVHLTPMEDICYRRLLDMYYETEQPIPTETDRVSRRLRLDTELVDSVLKEFFEYTENGWVNARCDAEISAYHVKADAARSNGKLGGRPNKTQSVILANPAETGSKANQEPITNNQEPERKKKTRGTRLSQDWILPDSWLEWALSQKQGWSRFDVERCADTFRDYWIAKSGKDAAKANWEATWRNWVRRDTTKPSGITVAEPQRPAITLETKRAAMQAQADEGYKIRKWLDGERRYRTVFKIEGESIKATKEYESEAMA